MVHAGEYSERLSYTDGSDGNFRVANRREVTRAVNIKRLAIFNFAYSFLEDFGDFGAPFVCCREAHYSSESAMSPLVSRRLLDM